MRTSLIRSLVLVVLAQGALACAAAADAQESRKVILWTDPGSVAARNLYWGGGSKAAAPKGPFTFIEEDTGGTQPKLEVRDAAGREWDVKFGEEVHAEVAANRFVWAMGYVTEPMYYVPSGTIRRVGKLDRAAEYVDSRGRFKEARFRLTGPRIDDTWTWEQNPFAGTKELSGLSILMTLLNNWDIQGDRNNRIHDRDGTHHYLVSDLGATFGLMGAFPLPRSKWDLKAFQDEDFIADVRDEEIVLAYEGYGPIGIVPMEHARWFSNLLSQLTDAQIRDAFRAAGASKAEIAGFSARVREKIEELKRATARTSIE